MAVTKMATKYIPNPSLDANKVQSTKRSQINHNKLILDKIFEPRGSTDIARNMALKYIRKHIESQLKDQDLSKIDLSAFVDDVMRAYERAQIRPGTPYGHGISEGFSSNVMQATLNTFHLAGSADSTGFDEIRGVLYLSPVRKNEEVYAHFLKRLSQKEILELRPKLVEVKANQLISSYEISSFDSLNTDYWWYQPQFSSIAVKSIEELVVLRLNLNVHKMVEFGISMAKLANKIIAAEDIPDCLTGKNTNVNVIFSPLKDGIVDIIFDEAQARSFAEGHNVNLDIGYRIFYNRCFLPHLNTILVSGVEGIHSMVVRSVNVITIVKSEEHLQDNEYHLHKNMLVANFGGVKDVEMVELLDAVGCEILKVGKHKYHVRSPNEKSPLTLIKSAPNIDHLKVHNYALLNTNRLRYILLQPYIDRDYTYSNNFFVMSSIFGLETARLYHEYNSFLVMAGTGQNTNSRYINAFSIISSSRGVMSGITFGGVAKYAGGFLSIATIEQSGNVFAQQALFNKNGESLKSVSSAIAVGTEPFIGTGAYPEEFMARRSMPRMEVMPILNVEDSKLRSMLGMENLSDPFAKTLNIKNTQRDLSQVLGIDVTIDNAIRDSDITPPAISPDEKPVNKYVGGRKKYVKPIRDDTKATAESFDRLGPVKIDTSPNKPRSNTVKPSEMSLIPDMPTLKVTPEKVKLSKIELIQRN